METSPSELAAAPAQAAPAAQERGRLEVDGHSLHWERTGDPGCPTVILLHHGLGSVRAWKRQTPALAAAGWQTLAYDRWGYGGSDPRSALDLPTFAADQRDLAAVMDAFALPAAALIGHSDGGTLALYFAARHPERVRRLVVVAAHIYVEVSMLPGLESVTRAYAQDAEVRAKLRRAHGEMTEAVFHNWVDGWRRPEHLTWDMRPLLHQIPCPTLVIQGELDEHATARHAHDIAGGVRQGTVWLIPGVGHMPPQEAPDLFNRRVLEFLEPARVRQDPVG